MRSFQETLRKFGRARVRPLAAAAESAGQAPEEILRELNRLGFSRCQFPEAYAGLSRPEECLSAAVAAAFEIAKGCAGIALAAPGPGPLASILLAAGTEEQKQAILPRFAGEEPVFAGFSLGQGLFPPDFSRVEIEAWPERAGYILQGRQSWVLNFDRAERLLIPARIGAGHSGGLGWFLLEKDAPGLKVKGRIPTLGLAAASLGEIELAECRVPAAARIGRQGAEAELEAGLIRTGLVFAGMAAGIIAASLEYCLAYAEDRVQFGAPIVEREAIALMLAEMKGDLRQGLSLLWRAVEEIETDPAPLSGPASSAMEAGVLAMAHLGPAGVRHATNAVQILGGYGYIRDYPCEKWLRDAKSLEVLMGGAERQKLWVVELWRRAK